MHEDSEAVVIELEAVDNAQAGRMCFATHCNDSAQHSEYQEHEAPRLALGAGFRGDHQSKRPCKFAHYVPPLKKMLGPSTVRRARNRHSERAQREWDVHD